MSNRLTLVLAAIVATIVFVFHLSAKSQPPEEFQNIRDKYVKPLSWQGKLAPDFEIELLSGEKLRLSEHIGKKVVILNFFATWCGPCKREMPELVSFYEKHRAKPFLFVGINSGESPKKVEDFVFEYGVTFPVGIDRGDGIQDLFGVKNFPTTVFIGADGVIQIYEIGPVMNADVAFDPLLKKSLDAIRSGRGIMKEAYLDGLKKQEGLNPKKKNNNELRGRAKTIAQDMYCPCGCSHKVINCNCKTAKNIKDRLRGGDFSGKTDAEVIRELNREFCVGNDKG